MADLQFIQLAMDAADIALLINEDRGGLAQKTVIDLRKMERFMFIESLDDMPVTLKKAKDLIGREKYTLALHFQPLFSAVTANRESG